MRILGRVAVFLVAALFLLYIGDSLSAWFRMKRNPQPLATLQVQTMWAVKLKNGRIDYSLGDLNTETCIQAIFPHSGYPPCWYLAKHTNKVITVGRLAPRDRVRLALVRRPPL